MIATLGWGIDAGLAGLFCACALAAAATPDYALVYAALIAGPAWALAAFVATPVFYRKKAVDPEAPRAYPGRRRRRSWRPDCSSSPESSSSR